MDKWPPPSDPEQDRREERRMLLLAGGASLFALLVYSPFIYAGVRMLLEHW